MKMEIMWQKNLLFSLGRRTFKNITTQELTSLNVTFLMPGKTSNAGVLNKPIVIYQSIAKVYW